MRLNLVTCWNHSLFAILAAAIVAIAPTPGKATINFTVSFDDPGGVFSPYYSQITSHTMAAGADWASHLTGNATLDVIIRFDSSIPTATGGSMAVSFVGASGGLNIWEPGAAAEVRTGIDPNGTAPDIEFTLGTSYLTNTLWFDPDPFARTAPVQFDRRDAMSTFLHEFGHALAFNGWRDSFNGTLPADYGSPFDKHTIFSGGDLFFVGPQATALYDGPVPLTFGNHKHFANNPPRPGSDLIPDLMNGVVGSRGRRYYISPLDLAVLIDSGVPVIESPGDFNFDGIVNHEDIDLLATAAHNDMDNLLYDLNDDGTVTFEVGLPDAPDPSDSDILIYEILATRYGDADLNREVFLSDLTALAANYRQLGQFGWAQGNFNGSREAGTTVSPQVFLADLSVLATNWRFGVGMGGGAGGAIPEPSGTSMVLWVALAVHHVRATRLREGFSSRFPAYL
jgi:hypothetical protein